MSGSLETIKEDFEYQVTDDQIMTMSSKLEDLTNRMQACTNNLDKDAEEILDSAAVQEGDQAEHTEEAAAGVNTVESSSVMSAGDWDIFCLEHAMWSEGQISAAMWNIPPISGTFKRKHSHVATELYMGPCTLLDIIATDSLYSTDIVTSGLNSDMKNITAGYISSPGEQCDLSNLRILSLHFPQGLRVAVWPRPCYTMMRDTSLEQMPLGLL